MIAACVQVPGETAGWLYLLVSVVESMPVCVTIADATLPGLPLVYVNREFCRVTGYSKSEAQGRNCRFLQGPDTELKSVAAVIEALRHGTDCVVRMTNYKRSGERMDSLLTLRSIYDSFGTYRYCIGTQIEADAERETLRTQSHLAVAFLSLLPNEVAIDMPKGSPFPSPRPGEQLAQATRPRMCTSQRTPEKLSRKTHRMLRVKVQFGSFETTFPEFLTRYT